jgi:hypothetical protein
VGQGDALYVLASTEWAIFNRKYTGSVLHNIPTHLAPSTSILAGLGDMGSPMVKPLESSASWDAAGGEEAKVGASKDACEQSSTSTCKL